MKALILFTTLLIGISSAKSQCSVSVNDSLLTSYDYVLNAVNVTGQAPFQFNWTVTDGNGASVPFTQNAVGDSITISSSTILNVYGCIIYELCMTDALNCTSCTLTDTNALSVPFNCFSAFNSSIVGTNQVSITTTGTIPAFLIQNQFMQWTDGNGQAQGMPYMGPGTVITYTPGPQNTNDEFYLCVMTTLINGGCIACDSVPYTTLGLKEQELGVSISPNPANHNLTIHAEKPVQSYAIYSIDGEKIDDNKVTVKNNEMLVPVSNIPTGIYFIHLDFGNQQTVRKIVVQH